MKRVVTNMAIYVSCKQIFCKILLKIVASKLSLYVQDIDFLEKKNNIFLVKFCNVFFSKYNYLPSFNRACDRVESMSSLLSYIVGISRVSHLNDRTIR